MDSYIGIGILAGSLIGFALNMIFNVQLRELSFLAYISITVLSIIAMITLGIIASILIWHIKNKIKGY